MNSTLEPSEEQIVGLREKHGLRSLTEAESGSGIKRLPNGIYGFTYSPGTAEMPLFQDGKSYNFEVHKLADGEVLLLGFVPEATAARIEAGSEEVDTRLKPSPSGEAPTLVSIPARRIVRCIEHSTRDGQGAQMVIARA